MLGMSYFLYVPLTKCRDSNRFTAKFTLRSCVPTSSRTMNRPQSYEVKWTPCEPVAGPCCACPEPPLAISDLARSAVTGRYTIVHA
ncbi:hypothetical protein C8R48DRAFT_698868 [Suillus tomentosus]|nr:hypothetical protein C8R48DRAFT_698868 [Suillus tomentosus]